jgi:uncharacterized protein (DUF736 family)
MPGRPLPKRHDPPNAWTVPSVKLDDPAFAAPLFARLVDTEDSKTFNLLWSRRSGD